jgi:PEGA domain
MRLSVLNRLILPAILSLLPVAASAQGTGNFGSLSITVRPAGAEIYIDGERWVSPDTNAPLVVELAPGSHTVQVRAPGYRAYNSSITIHSGESMPLNVILPSGPGAPAPSGEPLPPPPPGPPVPGRITQVSRTSTDDGFVWAPDFKITELNHRTTGFAGFYGGVVFAGQVMIGGGAYFQLDDYYHHDSEQMVYGGLVAEYRLFHDKPVGLTLHGLAGGGTANIGYYNNGGGRIYADPHHGGYDPYYGYPYGYAYEGFFVGLPEAQVVARFGRDVRLVGGIGYRWTSADFHDLNGVSGTIAVQIGK